MSGGHFAYKQCELDDIAGLISKLINENDTHGQYSNETLDCFHTAYVFVNLAKIYADRIDWLVCGDDSEETFHARLREDIVKLGMTVSCKKD